jgi:hypothetical protein
MTITLRNYFSHKINNNEKESQLDHGWVWRIAIGSIRGT